MVRQSNPATAWQAMPWMQSFGQKNIYLIATQLCLNTNFGVMRWNMHAVRTSPWNRCAKSLEVEVYPR